MSLREMIVAKSLGPVEVSEEAQKLINKYRYDKVIFDESYDENPLYALLRIMTYTRKIAYAIARKKADSFNCCDSMAANYLVYRQYMSDFHIAYDEFNRLFVLNEEEKDRLASAKEKLAEATAIGYEDDTYFMIDLYDQDSCLYGIEGIEYAR